MESRPITEDVSETLSNLSLEDKSLATWNALPSEVQDTILACLPFEELIKGRGICKNWRDVIKRKNFQQARGRLYPREFYLSPLVLYVRDDLWNILALDYEEKIWRTLPPFQQPIPVPDIDLFKDFLVAGHRGLFCVNVGKPSEPEKIFICNPLTGSTVKLPGLQFSRHPVVLNLHVTLTKTEDTFTSSYQVIAIGSSATGTESLSRKTEVYDSVKKKWEPADDVPGSDFSLNDHQTGVYLESQNVLLCVGFMGNGSKGILAFDVEKRQWREDWLCPLFVQHPVEDTALSVHFAIAQLVECSGVVYLFSEQEAGRNVTHCIDRLELISGGPGFTWTRKVTRQRQGYRALLVYPEYTCVPVGENKLCIFNTIERTGVVYNMLDDPINPDTTESIPVTPPMEDKLMFHSLNPIGYAFEPSFGVSV